MTLNGIQLALEKRPHFFRVICIAQYTFGPHITALRVKATQRKYVLEVVAAEWGSDLSTLTNTFMTFVRLAYSHASAIWIPVV